MTRQFLLIPADMSLPLQAVDMPDGSSLALLQKMVGGYVEATPVNDRDHEITLYVDEEGKMKHKPFNERATYLWTLIYNSVLDDFLVGDVVVTGGVGKDGEEQTVSKDVVELLQKVNS